MSASLTPSASWQRQLPRPQRSSAARRRRQQKQRRGILILIVLSLLFLFVMIAVTFVLVSNRANSTANKAAAADLLGDAPHQEVDMALLALVRGDNSPLSPLSNTSLLVDIYGDPPPNGAGANPNQYSKRVVGQYAVDANGYATVTLASTMNEYDGRVITVIPGSNTADKGSLVSSRIFASDGTQVYLLPFRDPSGKALVAGTYDFLINGREFAGTGKSSIENVNPVTSMAAGTDPSAAGGENESYDAPDFNNIHLAFVDVQTGKIKPSFHDSALIGQAGNKAAARFRPVISNGTTFDDNTGPWDVDNDGDGRVDSIWIDPGFPIQVSRDGRKYKRLIAPLILDLDGRLNLNTVGHNKEIAMLTQAPTNMIPFATGTAAGTIQLGHGHGFGPAEIQINKAPLAGIAQNLLQGKGRYHSDNEAGPDPANLYQNKLLGTPNDYPGSALALTRYTGSPPDHWGRYMRGIDFMGNVLFANYWQEGSAGGETANTPYLLDMSRDIGRGLDTTTTAKDNPFSASELERFLRGFDYDAGNLPKRLFDMTTNATEQQFVFRSATTDSWDTPVLGVLPQASAGGNPTKHFAELLPQASPFRANQQQLKTVIPPDMLAGLKFNINWPFGDGKDNNNNYVVDEIGENESTVNPTPSVYQGVDTNIDGSTNATDNYFARQQMAKYLYVLMTLIQNPGLTQAPNEQTQQRIAQWAVNVVDYMDADNVMTCFEYDLDLSNGWDSNANGYLTANDLTAGGDLRVVWGVEQPALLLTEAFAWHDRRVRDSKHDDGPKKKRDESGKDESDPKDKKRDDDPTLDQALIPRGPAFVELYAPHSPLQPVGSGDLYDYDQTNKVWRLKLDKLTPNQAPVWRILVTTSNSANQGNDYQNQAQTNAQVFTGQTVQNSATAGYSQNTLYNGAATVPQAAIERIVVFAKKGQIGGNYKDKDRLYCYSDESAAASSLQQGTPENLALFGGQYAVLFPHTFNSSAMGYTAGGAIQFPLGNIVDTTGSKKGIPSKQGININYSSGNPYASGGSGKNIIRFTDTNNGAHSSYGSVDFAAPVTIPIASFDNASGIGGSAWNSRVGFSVTEPLFSSNYYPQPMEQNPATGLMEAYGQAADDGMGTGAARDKPLESPTGDMPNAPLVVDNKLATGTYSNYKTLILQRVADPTRDYEENNNPYITVDWLPIDITVFNGDDRPPGANGEFDEGADPWDPDDPTANQGGGNNPNMGPRQRGQLTSYKQGQPMPGNTTDNSNYHLWTPRSMALGSPNPQAKNADAIFAYEVDRGSGTPAQTLGYLNASYGDPLPAASAKSPLYFGAPQRPFPNLSWNNRPYLNPMEVMLVPASQAGRLGMEYNTPLLTSEDYAGTNTGLTAPFGHLLNFFASSNGTNYHLILDWLTTGSPFKGTETWFDQTKSANFNAQGINKFRYPFNAVHGYREPGKININTVSDPRVWDAVMGNWGASGARYGCTFDELVHSRRDAAGNQLDANGSKPSFWGNPFRVASAANLTPSGLQQPTNNVGLLRKHPTKNNIPLFGPEVTTDYSEINSAAGNDYRDASRHRLMAVQNIERMSNLVTTRSNVYAMWVTVGYFEVTPVAVSPTYPDGYRIEQELGTDTGEIKRHRGFGIYDRSIPVGYERGMNHNVEKGFLIKKMLE